MRVLEGLGGAGQITLLELAKPTQPKCADGGFGGLGGVGQSLGTSQMRPKGANGRFGGVERGRAVIGDELNYSTTLRISQA